MSGICGIFAPRDPSLASRPALDAMIGAIAHRGRSTRRWFIDARHGVALGHVFAANGAGVESRPHWQETAHCVLTLDGTVFGTSETVPPTTAAAEHDARPGLLESASLESAALAPSRGVSRDARLAFEAFATGPERFPESLDGAFALAVWDRTRRELTLARDGLGTRPLLYAWLPSRRVLLFASELKGILAHPAAERDLDRDGLHAFLTFGYVPAPLTAFRGIRKVFPGERLRVGLGGALEEYPFWTPPPFQPRAAELPARAADVREAMIESIHKHAGDAPRPGVFLSGGIDSTIITAVLRQMGREVDTFTIGFRDERHPRLMEDARWAERVSGMLGTRHHAMILDSSHDPLPHVVGLLRHLDEPMIAINLHPKRLLADDAVAAGASFCMSGTSAGMLFERYPPDKIAKLARPSGDLTDITSLVLASRNGFVPCADQNDLVRDPHPDPRGLALAVIDRYRAAVDGTEPCDLLNATILRMQGTEKGIGIQERVSALTGLDMRFPFHDPGVVRVANTVPSRLMGAESAETRKAVLVRAFSDLLPAEVARREVIGFASYYWSRGEIEALQRRLLSPAALRETGLFRPEAVARLMAEDAASEKRSAGKRTWGLMVAQAWYRLFVQRADHLVVTVTVLIGTNWAAEVLDWIEPFADAV